MRCWMTQ